jgi:hypothetical protein
VEKWWKTLELASVRGHPHIGNPVATPEDEPKTVVSFYCPPPKYWREAAQRPVPGPMAPERCVTTRDCLGDVVELVGRDLDGRIRIRVFLSRDDVSAWWVKVIRHWLAWRYGAAEIKLLG